MILQGFWLNKQLVLQQLPQLLALALLHLSVRV
jgi:hypothetical protein